MSDIRSILGERVDRLSGRALAPVEVAVLDSGIDATHPDLQSRVVAAYAVTTADGVTSASEDAVGENRDVFGHGTAVASIIARLAPNARLVDIRILDSGNASTGVMFLEGFRASLRRRSRLVNLSLAATARFAQPLAALCETAYRQQQAVVAAKRNLPFPDLGYPAELSPTISVDRQQVDSEFVVRFLGSPIEFGARGDEIVCAAAGGGYTTMTGTSFATPIVTALCALMLGAYPDLTIFELKTVLKSLSTSL